MTQESLMKFDPATGEEKPYPSHAAQWRDRNGHDAWIFNPWTGDRRNAGDVGTDIFGFLILPPGEELHALSKVEDRYTDYDKLKSVFDEIGVTYELLEFKITNTIRVLHSDGDGYSYKGDFDFSKDGKFVG